MRLWSIHPMYLDVAGLTAFWREVLLARKVLVDETIGYKNHPQLIRFKQSSNPTSLIETYLFTIFEEASKRGYKFDSSKLDSNKINESIKTTVTKKQLEYEFEHLKYKLKQRNHLVYKQLITITNILSNPVFIIVDGEIESWEIIK